MKTRIFAALMIIMIAGMGCNEDEKGVITDGTGLDKKKTYKMTSSHMQKMTAETWDITGTAYDLRLDESIAPITGRLIRETGEYAEFEGRGAIPVREIFKVIFTDKNYGYQTGTADQPESTVEISTDITRFYSESGIVLGETDTNTGEIIGKISSDEKTSFGWPDEGHTGDFGFIEEITKTSGEKISSTWYFEPGEEGNADFTIKSAIKNQGEEDMVTENETFTINMAGDVIFRKKKIIDMDKKYRLEIDLTKQ